MQQRQGVFHVIDNDFIVTLRHLRQCGCQMRDGFVQFPSHANATSNPYATANSSTIASVSLMISQVLIFFLFPE